jgi:hypothetical protein
MKQNIGPIAIVIGVLALIGIGVLVFTLTQGGGTAGYTAPPADADMKAKAQQMGEDYGKKMQEQMKQRMQGGGPGAPPR